MRPEDISLMHKVWLDVTADLRFAGTHHYHVVALALEELENELHSEKREELLARLEREVRGDDLSSPTNPSASYFQIAGSPAKRPM